MNTALLPAPRATFNDANGVPLAGGFVWTYAAGTSTPQATYQDALGAAANPNPVVLDASGSASIWLGPQTYKIVLQDANGVQQWSQDNVSSVSLASLQGLSALASLSIVGNLSVGGNAAIAGTLSTAALSASGVAVTGALTATSETVSGAASVGGLLTAGSAAVTGNQTVGGTLAVTGETDLTTLKVGGVDINAIIAAAIPALTALAGTLVVSNVATVGNFVIFTFGSTAGTRVRIAFGAGTGIANGGAIPLPSGFGTTNLLAMASIGAVAATLGNQLSQFACSVTAGVITVTAADASGHSFTPTANWFAVGWVTGY